MVKKKTVKKTDCSKAKILIIMKNERERIFENRLKFFGGLVMVGLGIVSIICGGIYHGELGNDGTAILMLLCGAVTTFTGIYVMACMVDR